MRDIWSFLLQTLTASGAAALLLTVKALFRDKLSPRWQFASWGVLAVVLLVPANLGGRYALVNWPFYLEAVKSALTGEFGTLTQVSAPVPLPPAGPPRSAADWLFLAYLAGVVFFLGRYFLSYIRLRLALRRGLPANNARIRELGEFWGLPACKAVEVPGMSSAFVCGALKPVLVLPAGQTTDGKVVLHELLHLKHHDAAWGLVICFFRCLHWCNPLLWLCADLAGNDLESLCDQRVLERLEGENRRDYGRILLSMADEKYARTPGTSSMANGGANIRRRIEAIARFKRYPQGMGLVSVCVVLILAAPLLMGQRAEAVDSRAVQLSNSRTALFASARTTYCTTPAGAFDAYAKAVLRQYIPYRAMCAPLSEQNALAEAYQREAEAGTWAWEDCGLPGEAEWWESGYEILNLTPDREGYLGMLAVTLAHAPEGETWDSTSHSRWYALQTLRAEKEGDRWIIQVLDDFRAVQGDERMGGNLNLPAWIYEAQAGDFTLQTRFQTLSHVDSYQVNTSWIGSHREFLTTPIPGGHFSSEYHTMTLAYYTGDPADKDQYTRLGFSILPLEAGEERPDRLHGPGVSNASGSSSSGEDWGNHELEQGWESPIFLSGGGSGGSGGNEDWFYFPPEAYAAEFYLNGERMELTLTPAEGGGPYD